jgi:ABC-type ATPase involved in cell division
MDYLQIGELRDSLPASPSSGERQRAARAQALAKRPAALFLDEPTANLDRTNGQRVVSLLMRFCNAGMACVAATPNVGLLWARWDCK